MIYAAKINRVGVTAGTFFVTPLYTRIDGTDAPDIEAIPVNGLVPAVGDTVYCAEGINDFAPSMQLLINKNGGAYPLIFASMATSLVYTPDMHLSGKIKLGAGGKKMVLGDDLAAWAQAVDAALTALYAWGATGVAPGPTGGIAPFPGTPALVAWEVANLSQKHTLD